MKKTKKDSEDVLLITGLRIFLILIGIHLVFFGLIGMVISIPFMFIGIGFITAAVSIFLMIIGIRLILKIKNGKK